MRIQITSCSSPRRRGTAEHKCCCCSYRAFLPLSPRAPQMKTEPMLLPLATKAALVALVLVTLVPIPLVALVLVVLVLVWLGVVHHMARTAVAGRWVVCRGRRVASCRGRSAEPLMMSLCAGDQQLLGSPQLLLTPPSNVNPITQGLRDCSYVDPALATCLPGAAAVTHQGEGSRTGAHNLHTAPHRRSKG